jgi:hypothetical protein
VSAEFADSLVTLKYAGFITVAGCVIYFASLISGVLLSMAARVVTKIDLSSDVASATMSLVIAVTTVVALSAARLTGSAWVALLAGSAIFFAVGTATYASVIKRPPKRDETRRMSPKIGLLKASIVSAIVTISAAAVATVVLVAWALLRPA